MATGDGKKEQIKLYLTQLPEEAREKLMLAAEKMVTKDGSAGAEIAVILDLLREVARGKSEPDKEIDISRFGTPMRAFWEFAEPLFVDAPDNRKQVGRIPRSTLQNVWVWLNAELLPQHLPDLVDHARKRLAEDDESGAAALISQAKTLLAPVLGRALNMANENPAFRKGLAERLGGKNGLAHLQDIYAALTVENDVAAFFDEFPIAISSPSNAKLDAILEMAQPVLEKKPKCGAVYLALILKRFVDPVQALRLGVRALGNDESEAIFASPYRVIGDLVVFEMALKSRQTLQSVESDGLTQKTIDNVVAIARQMDVFDVELTLSDSDVWSEKMSDIRVQLATILAQEIMKLGPHMKALFSTIDGEIKDVDQAAKDKVDLVMQFAQDEAGVIESLGLKDQARVSLAKAEAVLDHVNSMFVSRIRKASKIERGLIMDHLYVSVDYTEMLKDVDAARIVRRLGEAAYSDTDNQSRSAA